MLPLVPGYLSAVSGVSLAEMKSGERSTLEDPAARDRLLPLVHDDLRRARDDRDRARLDARRTARQTLDKIAGAIIIALGVFFLLTPFVPRLNRDWRPDALISRAGSGGPIVAGAAFAIAWTPCIGPTLGAILNVAATQDSVGKGGVLLAFYSLGLAVPFLLTAVAFTRMTDRVPLAAQPLPGRSPAISGVILITMGVMLFTGELKQLNIQAQETLDGLGLNFFKSL